jgi:hypothetical protein
MTKSSSGDQYSDKEAIARFEAAPKSAMNTPHKPLKEKPKVEKKMRGQNYRRFISLAQAQHNSQPAGQPQYLYPTARRFVAAQLKPIQPCQ